VVGKLRQEDYEFLVRDIARYCLKTEKDKEKEIR
jgi:hypothetical protein